MTPVRAQFKLSSPGLTGRSSIQSDPGGRWSWVPAFAGTTLAMPSRAAEFLRQHQHLARALDLGPAAVEFGHQPFHGITAHGAVERGLIGELVHRQMLR